jgi:ATP-dependent exoDNAse (exonuclease V) alpha subunit
MAIQLDVVIGMPVMITKNIDPSKNLANGTVGHI